MPETKTDKFTTIISRKNGTTTEEVSSQLREMIQRGELSAGDRLPPERDLAKLLGVSRPTLRAGIRSLATVGILQSRQGAGTFVVEAEESATLDSSALKILSALHNFKPDEMFETHLSLGINIASFAAERATDEQIEHIAKEVAGMSDSVDNPERYIVHERQFYQIIANASGNRILTLLMNMIAAILSEGSRENVNAEDLKDSAEKSHKIYLAIQARNPVNAGEAMRESLLKNQAVRFN